LNDLINLERVLPKEVGERGVLNFDVTLLDSKRRFEVSVTNDSIAIEYVLVRHNMSFFLVRVGVVEGREVIGRQNQLIQVF